MRCAEGRRVYRDATMLLRPKTGLKDMVAELDPGTAPRRMDEGDVIPVEPDAAGRQPRRGAGRARRRHARLPEDRCSTPAARACAARATTWRDTIRPSSRPRAARSRGSARSSGAAQHQARHPQLLAAVGGARRQGRPGGRFVEDSNAVFAVLAGQEADIRATLRELPSALVRDAERARRPTRWPRARPDAAGAAAGRAGARPDAAQRAAVPARDDAGDPRRDPPAGARRRPDGHELGPTMQDLAAATPDLTRRSRSSTGCSTCSPSTRRASEEGFLFWVAWVNHIGD